MRKTIPYLGSPWANGRALAALLSVTLAVSFSEASQFRVPAEMGWVGLYNDALIQWLENENRLDDLCAAFKEYERDRCRDEKLRPQPFVIPLHSAPSSHSKSAGSLLLLAAPGKGLRFFFVEPDGGRPLVFEPDL